MNRLSRFRHKRTDVDPVDEVLPLGQLGALGIQHVLAMYASAVAVPLIIGGALKLGAADLQYLISACLLTSGIAALLQTIGFWKVGVRLPILQGTAFAAASTISAIGIHAGGGAGSLPLVFGAVMFGGVVVFALAPFFSALVRFLPPVVTGSVITVIGLSLLPVAVRWGRGQPQTADFGSAKNLALAGGTLLLVLLIQRFATGFVSRISILIGLVLGTAAAVPLGVTNFDRVADAPVFGVSTPFHFGTPQLTISAAVSIVIILLVIMVEVTGCMIAVGDMVGRKVHSADIARGLRADGLGTAIGGFLNSFPYGAYVSNLGLVALTGVRSRFVVAAAGAMLLVLGLFPKVGALAAAVPLPVLSGAGLVLFGTVAASGIRTLSQVSLADNRNLVIVAVAVGFGLVPLAAPEFYAPLPDTVRTVIGEGITASAIAATLLNLLFFHLPWRRQAPQAASSDPAPQPAAPDMEVSR
jgi:NCS2 family nucleobase:cation symporter-2